MKTSFLKNQEDNFKKNFEISLTSIFFLFSSESCGHEVADTFLERWEGVRMTP